MFGRHVGFVVLVGWVVFGLLVLPGWAVVTDNAQTLHVPVGESYTLYGTHSYTENILIEGTLNVTAYNGTGDTGVLVLTAPEISVSGIIDGAGKGFRAVEGPGTGTDGGGGGYGGQGGASGWGGVGGSSYGTLGETEIIKGSGGANSSGGSGGGRGGAAISLNAVLVSITGTVSVAGASGIYGSSWAAGGGSGGEILIQSSEIEISGTLSAVGGNGASSVMDWGGGGGGGGRIKIFYGYLDTTGSTIIYSGGSGGWGSFMGSAGQAGTYFASQDVFCDSIHALVIPSGQTYTLSGYHGYTDTVLINGTLYIAGYDGTAGTGELTLEAPTITVGTTGVINADGRGFRGRQDYQEGPGIGSYPSGGAGYGGAGGQATATNGKPYGTACENDIAKGSGGGDTTSGQYGGGDGGGCIVLYADDLTIEGTVTANGNNGLSTTMAAGAGGGSGGGILCRFGQGVVAGTLSTRGGTGGTSPIGGGCGGGGGRIKLFYNFLDTSGGTIDVSGGAGGNSAPGGQDGSYCVQANLTGDLNHDTKVNVIDFAIFAGHWLDGDL
ncbi:MAG: hypothetical protein JW936_03545 [Sedimentisphaerales bacterium]|nr:hypothetical protein [Sedimentisphaerales bacterium]